MIGRTPVAEGKDGRDHVDQDDLGVVDGVLEPDVWDSAPSIGPLTPATAIFVAHHAHILDVAVRG
jgi:hypothetical protein